MINKRTVLILGAGSSREVGFPSGKQLAEEIYVLLKEESKGFKKDPDGNIKEVLVANIKLLHKFLELSGKKRYDGAIYSEEDIENFANDLRRANLPSIDDFIFKRPHYSLMGKLCILFVLSKYEDATRFEPYRDVGGPNGKWVHPDWGWYEYLWHQLQRKTDGKFAHLKNNKLSIITFNYDRSLEYFLFNAIEAAYGLNSKDHIASDFFTNIPIKHVYGELGILPWKLNLQEYRDLHKQQSDAVNDFTPWNFNILFRLWGDIGEYGATQQDWDPGRDVLSNKSRKKITEIFINRANEVKTYDEIAHDEKCGEMLGQAERIYFLGCGYHEQNISALGLLNPGISGRGILNEDIKVFGTAVGKTEIETEQIKNYVASFSKAPAEVNIKNKWDGIEDDNLSKITSFLRSVAPLE